MLISEYLSSNIMISIFYYFTYLRELGQKYKNIFVQFWVQMKTSKFAFEINWPLVGRLSTDSMKIISSSFGKSDHGTE